MNPFKKDGQMLPIASINSVYIEDVLASDLFRPELIVHEIQKDRDFLGFSSEIKKDDLLFEFNNSLNNKSTQIKDKANEIAVSFGKKLANVLVTLKNPSITSVNNRPSWNEHHWKYWEGVKRIYFVGGLTSPILTSIFYNQIKLELKKNKISNLKVSFIEGSVDLGTKGLSTLVGDGEYLLFDFGQTNVKRRHTIKSNEDIVIDRVLPAIKSNYLFYKHKKVDELILLANELDNFISKTIIDTIENVDFKGDSIIVGIANYVFNGKIFSKRGGYGKLAYLNDNYELHLSNKISKLISKNIRVMLYHDTSAMALNFKDRKRTAVISLGTAFGIAFPE